ncbi:MAG: flavin reductase family protein [Pseudomonadota bacterium]
MSLFQFDQLTAQERYKMLCAAVIPRPVAWITTIDPDGVVNAAPYSFFNVFAEDPPLLIVGMNRKTTGERKDTLTNIERSGVFTVNLADTALRDAMVATAAEFPSGESEPQIMGLDVTPGSTIAVPRLTQAPISLECTLLDQKSFGPERELVFGKVSALYARDGLFDEATLRMTVPHYDPVARLFGAGYAQLAEPTERPIPDWRTIKV